MHIAICFAYLPDLNYSGFSKQLHDSNNIFTIIVKSLKNARLIENKTNSSIKFASRTDRGVGAVNQVISLFTNQIPITSEINSYLPENIRALGYTEVPVNFHPRKDAILRTYSYFLSTNKELDLPIVKKTLNSLTGNHNFRNFSKKDPKKEKNTIKEIKKADIFILDRFTYQIRISSKSFLWQQVRRIVGHLIDISNGNIDEQYTIRLLENDSIDFKPSPVPPQYLILENIQYKGIKFIYDQKTLSLFQNKLIDMFLMAKANIGLYSFLAKYITNLEDQ